ncbi:MAG: acetylornithine transaminase [Actinomycetaceae bacterium]|nr:acetylornithine transaminase [Arcanobacterium sp.]MDD7505323.1 acetylornithine transaminase [Actinomycetaceae bacterium]MDY6142960.1 acetylornithine transaminase [Arcanobacterium sp.]
MAGDQWEHAYAHSLTDAFGMPLLELDHGEGVYVWDTDGKKYLDLLAGIAVNALGYANPAQLKVLREQGERIMHASNFFTTRPQLELAATLQGLLDDEGYVGSDARVFFTNSGTEANEAALKIAYLHKKGGKILALRHGFHGRTLGALSITDKSAIRDPFLPLLPNIEFVDPDVASLDAAFDDSVAAIFMEPIQGEAGVQPIDPEVLLRARDLCDAHDAILVIDEVQTGMGRTGRWFAHSRHVKADVVTLAKGLGGGFPIGAAISLTRKSRVFTPGSHGTTFGGNPLACAVSLATIAQIRPLLAHVSQVGTWLREQLERGGYHTRGEGLLIGIEVTDSLRASQDLREQGIIVNNPNPNTIRLAPPLIIEPGDLEPFVSAMASMHGPQGV